MVYKEEHAIAIIQDGKIVPEKDGVVVLPYGSEYKIRLKNKSRIRSIADIYIDGSIACKGIIVDEDRTVDLERYIKPGDNMFAGNKFQLARLSHPGVADANDDQNGMVEVRFYKERAKPKKVEVEEHHHHHHHDHGHPWTPWQPYPWKVDVTWSTSHSDSKQYLCQTSMSDSAPSDYMCCDRSPVHTKGILRSTESKISARSADGPAATVQGGMSTQRFTSESIDIDETKFTALSIQLRGVTKVTRHDKCPGCSRKRKGAERFCPKCGTALIIEG